MAGKKCRERGQVGIRTVMARVEDLAAADGRRRGRRTRRQQAAGIRRCGFRWNGSGGERGRMADDTAAVRCFRAFVQEHITNSCTIYLSQILQISKL
jgi:hypothetical protein